LELKIFFSSSLARVFFEIAKFDFVKVSVCSSALSPAKILVCLIFVNLARTMPTAVNISEFLFEWDLQNIDLSQADIFSPEFSFQGSKFNLSLQKKKGSKKYGCFIETVEPLSKPGVIHYQFDLVKKLDNAVVKSHQGQRDLKELHRGRGKAEWIKLATIREHVLKVKMLLFKPFSDFVKKPIAFENAGFLLFKKKSSNLSFLVGGKVVFVIQDILTSRNEYFRAMLEGSFKEAQVPMTVESKIPIKEIDVDVFKMIIEWIYTMDIKRLNDPLSPTLLLDLQDVYVAADMYLLPDLCNFIRKYLNHFLTSRNFGDIYQVAKRIGSESLSKDVIRAWIYKSASFNENDDQIKVLIRDFDAVEIDDAEGESEDQEDELDGDAIVEISRSMIAASSWDGESESKLCVIKCLASFLSLDT
jgi:hypothetical protein